MSDPIHRFHRLQRQETGAGTTGRAAPGVLAVLGVVAVVLVAWAWTDDSAAPSTPRPAVPVRQPPAVVVADATSTAGPASGQDVRTAASPAAEVAAGGSGPEVMPQPVPLGRETRDPGAGVRTHAQQMADRERQIADSSAPRPGQVFEGATVTSADLGLAFMPGLAQDGRRSTVTGDAGYGRTVSTSLVGAGGLEAALVFYRRELLSRMPEARLAEARPGPEFATLTAQTATSTSTVFIHAPSSGPLAVTLTRWSTGGTPAAASAPAPGR